MRQIAAAWSASWVVALLALAGSAHAAEEPSAAPASATEPAEASPPRIELVLVGEAPGSAALPERVASWFRDSQASIRSGRAATLDASAVFAAADTPGVKIWIWLRTPGAARVFIAAREPEAGAQRYWVSDIALSRGLDELGAEELAQAVHLSALAVWAGNLESKRSEVEARLGAQAPRDAPPIAPEQKPPSESKRVATLGAEYSVRATGAEGPAQVTAMVVGVVYRSSERELGLRGHFGVLFVHHVRTSDLELTLNGGSVAFDAAVAFRSSKRLWLTGAVGPGADLVSYTPQGSRSFRAEPGGSDFRPFVHAEAGLRAELGGLTVGLSAAVSVQLLHVHYDVVDANGRTQVLAPWQVQPGLALAVLW